MPCSSLFHRPYGSRTIRDHIPSFSPCDLLPVELIAHIFLSGGFHEPDEICVKWPVVISSVCRRWRNIALTTQKLWQHINPTSECAGLPLTKLFLERAFSCDLYIEMLYCDLEYSSMEDGIGPATDEDFPWYERSRVEEALHVLSPHMGRWKELDVKVHFATSLSSFGDQLLFAPRLKELYVGHLETDPEISDACLPTVILRPDATPALEILYLDGVEPQIAEGPYLPRAARTLAEISLASLPCCAPSTLAQLLDHFETECLELCDFSFSHQVMAPISAQNLKHLALYHLPDPLDIIPLFETVRAPHLEKLMIHGDFEAFGRGEVLRALARSESCYVNLTTLVLYWWSYTSETCNPTFDDWTRFFAHHSRIETLLVNDMSSNSNMESMLTALSDMSHGQLLLPNLSHLGVQEADLRHILAFLDCLRARPRRTEKLRLSLNPGEAATNRCMLFRCAELLRDWGILDLSPIEELDSVDGIDSEAEAICNNINHIVNVLVRASRVVNRATSSNAGDHADVDLDSGLNSGSGDVPIADGAHFIMDAEADTSHPGITATPSSPGNPAVHH